MIEKLDNLLKKEKGWEKNIASGEFVYDYHLKSNKNIIVKVLTGIESKDLEQRRNVFKVFAIKQNSYGFVGIEKAITVNKDKDYEQNIKNAVCNMIQKIKQRLPG